MKKSDKIVKLSVVRASKELQASLDAWEKPTFNAEVLDSVRYHDEPPPMFVVKPTMSKTDRLLNCAFPWLREVVAEDDVGQPARFGSAWHELLEMTKPPSKRTITRVAAKWSRDGDVDANELEARYRGAKPVIEAWLSGENPWKIDFSRWRIEREMGLAYDYTNDSARRISPPTEDTHEYLDALPHEFPGAADLLAQPQLDEFIRGVRRIPQTILVLDYKSGFLIPLPGDSGQLKSLALAACRLTGATRAIIGFPHAPGDGSTPVVLADELSLEELEAHRDALRVAFSRIGDGTLGPGEHCKWCPAMRVCPAHTNALAEIRGGDGLLSSPEDAGAAHQRLTQLRYQFKQYDDLIATELRMFVKRHGACPRPDGAVVDLIERQYESLSKASIVSALGPLEGGRMIQKLAKLGCIKTQKRLELRKV